MKTNPLDPSLATLDACGCCAGLTARTPVPADNRPGLDAIAFRAGTHARFKASLLAALTSTNRPALARLLTREDDDATIALLDGFAAMADVLTFYSERIANESFLRTATERHSVLELARAIGYELRPGVAASTWLAFTVDDAPGAPGYAHVPIGTKVQSIPGPDEKPQTYETVAPLEARVDWNQWRASVEKKRTPLLDDQTISLAGLATGLKEGDGLLIIGEERRIDAGSERWDFRLVRSVKRVPATPTAAGYTVVTFDHPLGGRGVGRFPVPPTDTEPIHVFALRQRAAIFGHNAPDWRALSKDAKKGFYTGDTEPDEWPNFTIFTLSPSGTPLMLAAESEWRDATPEEVRTAANEAGQAVVADLRAEAMRSGGAALAGAAGTAAALVELSVKARDDVSKVAQTVADSVIQGNLHVIAQRLQALGTDPASALGAAVNQAVQNILDGFDTVRPALGNLLTGLTDAADGATRIIDAFREQIDTALATVSAPTSDHAAVVRAIADKAKEMVSGADIESLLKKLIRHPDQIGSIKTAIIKAAKEAINTHEFDQLVPNPSSAVTEALGRAKDAVTHANLQIPTGLDPAAIAEVIKTKRVDLASQLLQNAAHGAEAVEKVRGMAEQLLRSALTNTQQDMQTAADGIRTTALQAAEAVATDANLLNNLRAQAGSVGDSARQSMRQLLGMGAAEFVARVVGFALTEAAKNPQTADSMARTAIDAADAAAKAVPWAIRGAGAVTAAGLAAGPFVGLGAVAVVLSPLAAAILAPFVAIASGSATALFVGGLETEILPAAITGADSARDRIDAAVETAKQPTQFSHTLSATKPTTSDTIDLDRVYPEIMKGDWVVIDDSSYEEVFRVESVLEKSRTGFLLTAKTTRLQLQGEWEHVDASAVRDATVFVGAQELFRAEPDHAPVFGLTVELDRIVSDLKVGRPLLLQGRRACVRTIDSTGLALTDAKGNTWTVPWNARLTVLMLPDSLAKRGTPAQWRLVDDAGREGLAIVAPNRLEFVAAADDAGLLTESMTLHRVLASADGKRSVLEFVALLANVYDPATVAIYGNVSLATHGESVAEVLGSGAAGQPHQQFTLKQAPLTFTAANTPTGGESSLAVYVNDVKWTEVDSLYGRGPRERIFVSRRDNDGTTRLTFGDGWSGALLPTDRENLTAYYRKGIGLEGNVRPGQLALLMNRPLGVRSVTNFVASSGAQDPEQLEEARRNAPWQTLTLGRIVSLQDYEDFARAFSGIAKAHATWIWTPSGRGVHLTVAAPNGGDLSDDGETLKNLRAALRDFGNRVVPVQAAIGLVTPFVVAGQVTCAADRRVEKVKPAVDAALQAAFNFDSRDFGQNLAFSEVVALIQNIPGIDAVSLSKLQYRDRAGDHDPLNQMLIAARPKPGTALAKAGPAEVLVLAAETLAGLTVNKR